MKTTKNFNLEMFKNGAEVQTKLGNPVKFITITNDGKLFVSVKHRNRIVGTNNKTVAPTLVASNEKYNLDGTKYKGASTMYDLEMVKSYPIKTQPRDSKGRFVKM